MTSQQRSVFVVSYSTNDGWGNTIDSIWTSSASAEFRKSELEERWISCKPIEEILLNCGDKK